MSSVPPPLPLPLLELLILAAVELPVICNIQGLSPLVLVLSVMELFRVPPLLFEMAIAIWQEAPAASRMPVQPSLVVLM